jgi:hypothetical protein
MSVLSYTATIGLVSCDDYDCWCEWEPFTTDADDWQPFSGDPMTFEGF